MAREKGSRAHAERERQAVLDLTRETSGTGSRVTEGKMMQAARFWLEHEEKYKQPPSALSVGHALGLSLAPEWLASPRFLSYLEIGRFQRRVAQMQARPELTNLVNEVIDLGLLEAQKRLILSPGEIPNTVLFGDILHKLPKMVQEFTAGVKPVKAGDVFVTLVKEINLMQDPGARERLRREILGQYESAVSALGTAGVKPVDSVYEETVDAEVSVGGNVASTDNGSLVEPSPNEPEPSPVASDRDNDGILWSDPSLD